MTTLTPELLDQIRKLSPADKARVQEELAHEVEPLSDEWKAEIRRRLSLLEQGKTKLYSTEELRSSTDPRLGLDPTDEA